MNIEKKKDLDTIGLIVWSLVKVWDDENIREDIREEEEKND